MQAQWNPFNVLNIEAKYDISEQELLKTYFLAQKIVHPDKHSGTLSQCITSEKSAQCHRAYQDIIDPLKRAYILLKMHGYDPDELQPNMMHVFAVIESDKDTLHTHCMNLYTDICHAFSENDYTKAREIYVEWQYLFKHCSKQNV